MRLRYSAGLLALVAIFSLSAASCTSGTKDTTTTTEKTTGGAGAVKVGDTAPDFEMRNQEQLKVTLADYKDKKNVVLVFYPADFTPV